MGNIANDTLKIKIINQLIIIMIIIIDSVSIKKINRHTSECWTLTGDQQLIEEKNLGDSDLENRKSPENASRS